MLQNVLKTAVSGHRCGYNVPVKPHISVVEDDPDISRLVCAIIWKAPDSPSNFTPPAMPSWPSRAPTADGFILDIMVPAGRARTLPAIRQTNPSL